MRNCPVCKSADAEKIGSMAYKVPDGWPLPKEIHWWVCDRCGMLYGDGEFDQQMLDLYYLNYYGYGLQYEDNVARLEGDAIQIALALPNKESVIVDFGGAGDDGTSVVVKKLREWGYEQTYCVGPGDPLPSNVDLIFASHVLEHIYDLPQTMERLMECLKPDGTLVIDGPEAAGLARKWGVNILDFNTKHVNHFTVRDYLNLAHEYGLELLHGEAYELDFIVAGWQGWFNRFDTASTSMDLIRKRVFPAVAKVNLIDGPVNVWGMSDASWHILAQAEVEVLEYIDNDPAYRGKTYDGKPVLERPTNDAPILIMAQGQRKRLIENIRAAGITNEIIEV